MAGRQKKVKFESPSPTQGGIDFLTEIARGLLSRNRLKERLSADPILRDEADILTVDDLPSLFVCAKNSAVLNGVPRELILHPSARPGETILNPKYHPTWFPPYIEYVSQSQHGKAILQDNSTRWLNDISEDREGLRPFAAQILTFALSQAASAYSIVARYIQKHAQVDEDSLGTELRHAFRRHQKFYGELDALFDDWANRGLLLALSKSKNAELACRMMLEIQFKIMTSKDYSPAATRSIKRSCVLSRWAITETMIDLGEWKSKLSDIRRDQIEPTRNGLRKILADSKANKYAVWEMAEAAVNYFCLDAVFRPQWAQEAATKGSALFDRFHTAGIALEKSAAPKSMLAAPTEVIAIHKKIDGVTSGWYWVTDLAKRHGVNRDALRKRLNRARDAEEIQGWKIENRKSTEEAFMYLEHEALPYIEEMTLKRQKKSGGET